MNNCEMKERKRILLTGGPTNEPIDEVMKITNQTFSPLFMTVYPGLPFSSNSIFRTVWRDKQYRY